MADPPVSPAYPHARRHARIDFEFLHSGANGHTTVRMQATQVIFAGGRIVSQIRAADFTRDSSYYSFRNAIDQVVATTRQQFYQVLLDRALIGVQEDIGPAVEEPAAGSAKSVRGGHRAALQCSTGAGSAFEPVSRS